MATDQDMNQITLEVVAALTVFSSIQAFSLNIVSNAQADGDINNFEADES